MRLYLSSYQFGNDPKQLAELMPKNKRIGYIPNACDFTAVDVKRRDDTNKAEMLELKQLGLKPELLDLRDYFGEEDKLRKKIISLGGVFVRGGNTFILRQAMRLSGFDIIFSEMKDTDFLYSGYSAGICVLAPSLKALQIVDDPDDFPYKEIKKTVWEGLNYLDYMILPHYRSNHPESPAIEKEVEFCKKNKIKFKTLKDGEVIII